MVPATAATDPSNGCLAAQPFLRVKVTTSGLGVPFIGTNVSQPPSGVPVPKNVGPKSIGVTSSRRVVSPLVSSFSVAPMFPAGMVVLLIVKTDDRRDTRVQQLERIFRASATPHPASKAGAVPAFDSVH